MWFTVSHIPLLKGERMTRLEQLIVKVAMNNTVVPEDIAAIKEYPNDEVERAVTELASVAPYWVIQKLNQSNVWGK